MTQRVDSCVILFQWVAA